jgi:hypothetical protein
MQAPFAHWKVAYGLRRVQYTGSTRSMPVPHFLQALSNAGGSSLSGAGSLWENTSPKGRLSSAKGEGESPISMLVPLF